MIKVPQRPTWVLLQTPIPASQSTSLLGCFVGLPGDPTSEIVPISPEQRRALGQELDSQGNSWTSQRSSFRSHYDSARSNHIRAKLDQLFQFATSTSKKQGHQLVADEVTTQKLNSHRAAFLKLIKNPEIRRELLDLLEVRGGRAYMVVATRSFNSANVEISDGAMKEKSGSVELPAKAIVEAASHGTVQGDFIPNPKVEAGRKQTAAFTSSQVFEDQSIYSIEYRKVASKRITLFFKSSTGRNPELGDVAEVDWGAGSFQDECEEVMYEDDELVVGGTVENEGKQAFEDNDLFISEEDLEVADLLTEDALLA